MHYANDYGVRSLLDFPPLLLAPIVVVSLLTLLIFSYLFHWLQELDLGTGDAGLPLLEDPSSLDKVRCPSIYNPPEKYISLIVPVYNEETRLPGTMDETIRYLQRRAREDKNFTYEIIIVDDGSTDNTVKVAFEYVKKFNIDIVRVIKQGANFGKGAAIKKGMLCSRGELLLMLDADGATKITDLAKLEKNIWNFAESHPRAGVIASKNSASELSGIPITAFGSRAHMEKQALATHSWYRNFTMKCFHMCVLLVAGSGVRDTQCGFKMFTRAAARRLFQNMRLKRWCFDVELVYLCKRLHIPIMEVAVNWTEIPGSKLSLTSIIHMLFELVLVRIGYGFHLWKVHQSFVQS